MFAKFFKKKTKNQIAKNLRYQKNIKDVPKIGNIDQLPKIAKIIKNHQFQKSFSKKKK